MRYASSALNRCRLSLSSSAKTATVRLPSSLAARMMRMAISPRLAIRIFLKSAMAFTPGWSRLGATRGDAALRRCDLVGFVKGLRNPAFWVFAGWGNFLPRRVEAPTRQGQGRRRSLAGLFLCLALGRLSGFFPGLGRRFIVRLGLFLVGLLVLGFFGLGLFLVSLFGLGLLRVRLFLIRLFLAALLRRGFLGLLPVCLARCLGLCLGGGGGRRPLGQRRGGVDEAPRAIR